jgi:phosphatidylinositol glycan class W
MTPEYKQAKEDFVSHFSGGGIWEINYVTLVAPVRKMCSFVLRFER